MAKNNLEAKIKAVFDNDTAKSLLIDLKTIYVDPSSLKGSPEETAHAIGSADVIKRLLSVVFKNTITDEEVIAYQQHKDELDLFGED